MEETLSLSLPKVLPITSYGWQYSMPNTVASYSADIPLPKHIVFVKSAICETRPALDINRLNQTSDMHGDAKRGVYITYLSCFSLLWLIVQQNGKISEGKNAAY